MCHGLILSTSGLAAARYHEDVYREAPPSPLFADSVECFWSFRSDGPPHRVFPDGCADIVFDGTLRAVGAMTRYADHCSRPGTLVAGVRFRPGSCAAHLGIPADRLTDAIMPLEDLWGAARGRGLLDRVSAAGSLSEIAAAFEAALRPAAETGPVERAIRWMENQHGVISIGEMADQAGLSPRQFRRVCLERTGLTPKFLARVLRFRHAQQRIGAMRAADLAAECGYYDQAHLIHEFRALTGGTPKMSVFSNPLPSPAR